MMAVIDQYAGAMYAAGIPLSSISVAMTYDDRRAMLRLSWGIPRVPVGAVADGVSMSGAQRQDTMILIWITYEAEILDVAWRLGAWDVLRTEHTPIPTTQDEAEAAGFVLYTLDAIGDPRHPSWGLTASFCGCSYQINGEDTDVGDACPSDLLDKAAKRGWVTWYYKPTRWSVRVGSNNDRTLLPDGSRDEREMPIFPAPLRRRAHQHVYRFGRAPHGNRKKSDRNASY